MPDKETLISRARAMRKEPSRAERNLWKLLRDRRLAGFKFRRQHPIDRYIADFACIREKLIVEVDGLSHDVPEQEEYDFERERRLNRLGWRLLHMRDSEVHSDDMRVLAKILHALGHPPSP